MKSLIPVLAFAAFLALVVVGCDSSVLSDDTDTPAERTVESGQIIAGKYIVVLDKSRIPAGKTPRDLAAGMALELGVEPDFVYGSTVAGFAGALSSSQLTQLEQDDRVSFIEPDQWVVINPIRIDGGIGIEGRGKPGGGGGGDPAQSVPPGISRVNGGAPYTGSGVAWVIDTGIDETHNDLNVRADLGFSAFTRGKDAGTTDGHGHGTHVAGTIAAVDNAIGVVGVAAGATVIPVKVLDSRGSGSNSGVIAGVDFVGANGSAGDVANMSLGGGVSAALDAAVIAASSKVKFALAAGNESDDANNHSPARANGNNIYTVSAVDSADRFAYFSNYGNPPVDWAAPGVSILSTWKSGGYNTISGTSMATPHVAGLLLLGNLRDGGPALNDPDGNPDRIAIH